MTRWLPLGALLVGGTAGLVLACDAFAGDEITPAEDAGPSPEASTAETGPPSPPAACAKADLASDRDNCGACGHSCLGGDCAAGVCLPTVVGTSVGEAVFDVAVDTTRVLWLTAKGPWGGAGHVFSCPKSKCTSRASLVSPTTLLNNLMATDTNAFVSFSYGSRRIERILPDDTLMNIGTSDHNSAVRLQDRAGHLLFLAVGEVGSGTYAGSVYEWDGTTELVRAKFDGATNFNDLTAIGNEVYISAYGQIARCTVAACAPFTTQTAGVARMTTDGSRVIWTAYEAQEVRACATGPGVTSCPNPVSLLGAAQLGSRPLLVTVARGTMYVTTQGGDIFACSPADCTGTVKKVAHEDRLYVGGEAVYGTSVAADDTAIYWAAVDGNGPLVDAGPDGSLVESTSGLTHRIMRLAK